MQIELFLVPPGNREFRNTLISKALEGIEAPDFSNILYVAPTRHMIERWQREFHPKAGDCYRPPRADTLSGLARRIYASEAGDVIIDKKLAPFVISGLGGHGTGFSKVLADFIGDMKNHFPGEDAEAIREKLTEIFGRLFIPDEVAKRVYDALDTFTVYNNAMKAAGASDEDDALVRAPSIAERKPGAQVLVLDGFYEVTPAELGFIKTLIGKAQKTLIAIPISGEDDDLRHCYSEDIVKEFGVKPERFDAGDEPSLAYVTSQSKEDELEGIARHIKSLYVSGKLRELEGVYVAFPKLSEYREMLSRVFTRYGIPYSPEPQSTRPYRDVLSLVTAVRDGFPRLATARFLTSPYFRGIPEEVRQATPAIALEAGTVHGRASWLRALKAEGLEKEATRIFDKASSLINVNTATYTAYINVLLDILKAFKFSVEAEELDGIEGTIRELMVLDSVPGVERPTLRVFAEVLEGYLAGKATAGRGERDGVRVADLREIRGLEPEYLYLGGLKDGDLPARPEVDFLLPESVRRELKLVDMHRYLRLQGYIFRRLVSSARHLRLSYPAMEGEKVFIPSLYLRGAEETVEQLYGDFSPEEEMTRRGGEPLSSAIGEIDDLKGFRDTSSLRVTDIDAYRSCPRRYFIERILGIEPREIKEYEVDPKTIGIVLHEVMEKLIGPAISGFDAFQARAERVIDKVLEGREIEDYFKALLKASFMTILPDIYEIEDGLASEGYAPAKTEYSIKGEPLPGISLRGKIDRVDVRDDGSALVLDYKTGGAELSSTGILKRGETLQPFIYSALLKAEGKERPESVGIYSLKDLRIKRVPDQRDIKEGRTIEHFIETALLYLDSAVSAMREGSFRAEPLNDASCRTCHERPYCPYMQGGAK